MKPILYGINYKFNCILLLLFYYEKIIGSIFLTSCIVISSFILLKPLNDGLTVTSLANIETLADGEYDFGHVGVAESEAQTSAVMEVHICVACHTEMYLADHSFYYSFLFSISGVYYRNIKLF